MMQKVSVLSKHRVLFLVLVGFIVLAIAGFIYSRQNTSIESFMDSTGITWRVLAEDNDGNRLIITEHVHGLSQYNTTNIYSLLGNSDGLRAALNRWPLAPELRAMALPVHNVNNDARIEPVPLIGWEMWQTPEALANEIEPQGMTSAGVGMATPENSLFVLSVSEVNEYLRRGTLNKQGYEYRGHGRFIPVSWWLRSPGVCDERPIAYVKWFESNRDWMFETVWATESIGFRPALWIKPS